MGTHIHIYSQPCACVCECGGGDCVAVVCCATFFYAQLTQLQVRHAAKQTQRAPCIPLLLPYTALGAPTHAYTHTHTHPAFIIITSQNICAQPCQNNAENVDECSGHSAPRAHTHTYTDRYSTLHTYRRQLARQRGVKLHKKSKKATAKSSQAESRRGERGDGSWGGLVNVLICLQQLLSGVRIKCQAHIKHQLFINKSAAHLRTKHFIAYFRGQQQWRRDKWPNIITPAIIWALPAAAQPTTTTTTTVRIAV